MSFPQDRFLGALLRRDLLQEMEMTVERRHRKRERGLERLAAKQNFGLVRKTRRSEAPYERGNSKVRDGLNMLSGFDNMILDIVRGRIHAVHI